MARPEGDDAPALTRCPRATGWRWRNLDTGEIRPDRCKRNGCPWCIVVNARRRASAITYAMPERYIVLTQVGGDWQTRRSRVKDVTRDLRGLLGRSLQWSWTIEPNPRDTGYHLNAYQWGDFIPQDDLSKIARRRGMGEVCWITRLHSREATGYALKLAGAPTYGLKEATARETGQAFLEANGGRLTHQTRGFWRHPSGEAIQGAREAERAALVARFGHAEGEWVREREDENGGDHRD